MQEATSCVHMACGHQSPGEAVSLPHCWFSYVHLSYVSIIVMISIEAFQPTSFSPLRRHDLSRVVPTIAHFDRPTTRQWALPCKLASQRLLGPGQHGASPPPRCRRMRRCAAAALSSRPSPPACWLPMHRHAAAVAVTLCSAEGLCWLAVLVAVLLQGASQQAADCLAACSDQQSSGGAEGIAAVHGRELGGVLRRVPSGGVSASQCSYDMSDVHNSPSADTRAERRGRGGGAGGRGSQSDS